jgi:hypothetical protein
MEAQPEVPDVVEQEATPPVSRWVWMVLVGALLVGAAAWTVDEHRRGREDAALTSCRARLHLADQEASARLSRVADYLRPSLANLPTDLAFRLADPMRSPARIALPGVRSAAETCRHVTVWSWHEPTHDRREATVAYADRLLERLQLVAHVGGTYFEADRELDRLRARADLS